ncbi:hypothetical protein CIW49_20410 [Mycolicibacterium sp. P1-18]|uniref:hypothetical protein n=1 Tax=Mycolicibacterium sp. P1-18 TaxID=2024615 RepID=UPI0011F3AD17|nr:hypothetical protein [Mycolicibacterium sp. P1-18]KAA0095926.1 hypothetical protein CIW49_20410 [Mycolicibacterium sp. P1-18]
MTVRNLGAEHAYDDFDDGWFGAEQADDAPSPPPPRQDPRPTPPEDDAEANTDRWFVGDLVPPDVAEPPPAAVAPEPVAATVDVVPTRRNGFVRASAPASYESRIANSGAWEFKSSSTTRPAVRPRAVMGVAAVLVLVAAVVGVVLILRSPTGDRPAPAAPSESSAPAAPSTSAPAVVSATPLPPPVLPPPPPPAEEITPPAATRQYSPSYQEPDAPKKPQQNVTRAPLSATPPPPPRQTDRGRATPGQSGSHGFFG